jgi:SAM-dependent methyltransferase
VLREQAAAAGRTTTWDPSLARWLVAHPQTLWRRHSDAVHTALLERWLPHGLGSTLKTDLFDEAVSDGLYPALVARSRSVVGMDASAVVVESALARHPQLTGVCADVLELPFDDGEFDAVVSNSTLDHLDTRAELVAALREVRRVLKPGGTLVLTLDNPWNPVVALSKALPRRALNRVWSRVGRPSSRIGLVPYHVGTTLSLRSGRVALREVGFALDEVTAVVHAPRALAVVAGSMLERHSASAAQERFLSALAACERLGGAPTRFLSGHLVAFRARAA